MRRQTPFTTPKAYKDVRLVGQVIPLKLEGPTVTQDWKEMNIWSQNAPLGSSYQSRLNGSSDNVHHGICKAIQHNLRSIEPCGFF